MLKNIKTKKAQYLYMLPPRGVLTAYRIWTNFGRAGNFPYVITHAKCQIDWNTIVTSAKGWIFMF